MFSHNELQVIREMCDDAVVAHEAALKTFNIQDLKEAEDYANVQAQIAAAHSIIMECVNMQDQCVSLDADHMGYLYQEMDVYKELLDKQAKEGTIGAEEYAAEMEHVGWLMAKLSIGMVTHDEYEMIGARIEI